MKYVVLILNILVLFIIILTGCNKRSPTESTPNTITDIDGNIYQTVKIGNQVWMAENLKVTHYRNGDAIPYETNDNDWAHLTTGAYCVYDIDVNNADTYGNFYNWYAINDNRNIAPPGWHVSTDEDWKELEMFLGMSQEEADDTISDRGTNEGSKIAGNAALWLDGSLELNAAFGESGFSALPAGFRNHGDGNFAGICRNARFWTSTESVSIYSWYRVLHYNFSIITRANYDKRYGYSIRLVRD